MYCNGVHILTFQTRFVTLRSVLGLLCLEGTYRCIIEDSDNCEPNVKKMKVFNYRPIQCKCIKCAMNPVQTYFNHGFGKV